MSTNKKQRSVFSTTINDLVRSAVGGNARQVSDKDLDSYVADLITAEAQAKQAKYKTHGVRAYQPNPEVPQSSSKPMKPNKRFLMNIVKATDNHNQSVIREAEEKARAFQQKLRKQNELDSKSIRARLHQRRDHGQHSRKRKLSHNSDDDDGDDNDDDQQSDESAMNSNSDDHTSSSEDDDNDVSRVQYRGRGKIRNGSSMDKYFNDDYDAAKDMDSDQDTPSQQPVKKRKKNKSQHKSKKSSKGSKSSKSSKKKKHRYRSSKKSKKDSNM